MLWAEVKKFVPRSVKSSAKTILQAYRFERALRALLRLSSCEIPQVALVEELAAAWGNQGFAAKGNYLFELCSRAARAKGSILECGSGLSTILLGVLAGRRGIPVWSLEHIPEWAGRSQKVIARHEFTNSHICFAPLRDFGEFDWYDPPKELPSGFSFVVCDGPPASVRGGRYGLLPLLGARLTDRAVILLDDAVRPEEKEVMRRWDAEFRVSSELRNSADSSFAVLTCPAAVRLAKASASGR